MLRLLGAMLLLLGVQSAWAVTITLNSVNQGGDSQFDAELLAGSGTLQVGILPLYRRWNAIKNDFLSRSTPIPVSAVMPMENPTG